MAGTTQGTYWRGQDGNVWVQGANGVNNAGAWDSNTDGYWTGKGYNAVTDPSVGQYGTNEDPAQQAIYDRISASGGGGSVLGASTTASSTAQDQLDEQTYWADQLANADKQLARLPGQEQTGRQNIDNSYQSALARLMGDKAITERDFNTKKQQTIDDNVTAKSNIDTSVSKRFSAIQKLLGARGAGGSSAAEVLAPYMVGKTGAQQRNQVQTAFARNSQGLDTAFGDYNREYDESVGDLGVQKESQFKTLTSGVRQSEADLLEAKANAELQRAQAGGQNYTQARGVRTPYLNRIQQLVGEIDSLGANPTFTPKTAAFKAPELASYSYDRYAGPQVNGQQDSVTQNLGAYTSLLNPKKKQLA